MKLYQAIAVFIVLIGSCAGLCSHYHEFKRCEQIIDTFEEALIKEESNIFALNRLFFPSNQHPASRFTVGYIGPGNSTLKLYVRSWCKSTAHTLASPFMLQTLFTGLTYVYHMKVSRQEDIIPSILLLNITEHNFSDEEINYALDYITPWLKLYTRKEVQSGEISYKEEEKGYMCDVGSFNWYLMAGTVVVTIAAICMSCKVLYYLLNAKSERPDVKRAVFFSLGFVAFFGNAVDVGFVMYVVYIYMEDIHQLIVKELIDPEIRKRFVTDSTILSHGIVKVLELAVSIVVFGLGGLITSCCCSDDIKQPQLHVCTAKSSRSSAAKNICSYASKCAYFLYFANFFYFAYMVGANVLPTFLMLLITPIETLSVLVFFVSLLSSCVMFITITTVRYEKKKKEKKRFLFKAFVYFLAALLPIVLLIVVFLKTLSSITNSNASHLAPVILSLGSATLPIMGGYFTQKILSEKNTSNVESGTQTHINDYFTQKILSEKNTSNVESGTHINDSENEEAPEETTPNDEIQENDSENEEAPGETPNDEIHENGGDNEEATGKSPLIRKE